MAKVDEATTRLCLIIKAYSVRSATMKERRFTNDKDLDIFSGLFFLVVRIG